LIERIRTRDAFLRLRREGRRVRVGPLRCTFLSDPDLTSPAVAFAIGRAVGNAVVRNRLRRRLRAILAASDVPPGLLLIAASPAVTELSFEELSSITEKMVIEVRRSVT
jgi:ribonuclease P protein component